jgi:hypothetical protein
LIEKLREKGKTCYNFCLKPGDPEHPENHPDDQMKVFESTEDFYNNKMFQEYHQRDLDGLKNAEKVILLLPAGTSAHIEAGIAFGWGKSLILIGEPAKPETLYLIFKERYKTADEFLASIK